MSRERVIGVIGGSGLYDMDGLTAIEKVRLDTPFGAPSDEYVTGRLGDARLVFLPRHGRGHRILPHEINFRANIHGMKQLGVEWIISVSAVGSMREEIRPGDLVIVDQFYDRTKARASSFFGEGAAGHVQFADPVCGVLAGRLPEAKLAREAEICYATVALSTDYDCWHDAEEDVSVEAVLAVVRQNVATARDLIRRAAVAIAPPRDCPCAEAARFALMTDKASLSAEARERLQLIVGRYL